MLLVTKVELMNKQQRTSPWETEYYDFDYDDVDPETLKAWESEYRRKTWRDMRNYLKRFPDATPEEKKALRSWVRKGRSPYDNGWYIANESGEPMDFINSLRFLEDEYKEFMKDSEGYQGRPNERPDNTNSSSGSSTDDLPF